MSGTCPKCKICDAPTVFFDAVDLHKNCNENAGVFLQYTGISVEYHQCKECGFIFTCYFDDFTVSDFTETIYNQDYIKVDPLYPEIRPRSNAKFLYDVLAQSYTDSRYPDILDYGAGSGKLSEYLQRYPINITNYDPLNPLFNTLPDKKFDLVFSSEVIEHVPCPKSLVQDWASVLERHGAILFSTMLQPENINHIKASWWYISPRNGHISIFSCLSLETLFAGYGLHYEAISSEWHLAFLENDKHKIDIANLKTIVGQLPTGFIRLD